ncbi:UNVERIFIED_CONTAM: hypothetical protein Slati_2160200 [Sesamum latifolium]|uniref:Pr1-like protein n=1 Tax=Sesamum latifolium TaxID=2727402 RepID=A0AAW2WW98_9LAMI
MERERDGGSEGRGAVVRTGEAGEMEQGRPTSEVGMGHQARRLEVERGGGGIGKAPSTGEQGEERGEAATARARGRR